jgi:hypothetical protein
MGLAARRVWSKRGILVGSLLGATLVTALLTIVPLYEASVQAVDLRFTVRGATSDAVDVAELVSYDDYFADVAAANSRLVGERADKLLARWYPERVERVQTREVVVIPLGFDWFGIADLWRDTIAAAIEDELDPEEWPPPPYPTPPSEATTARILTSPSLSDQLVVLAGTMPTARPNLFTDPAQPVAMALGKDVAATMRVDVGDRFLLRPFSALPHVFELVEVAAIVEAADPGNKLWGIDRPGSMFYLTQENFDFWTTSQAVAADSDAWLRPARGFVGIAATQRWIIGFDPETL